MEAPLTDRLHFRTTYVYFFSYFKMNHLQKELIKDMFLIFDFEILLNLMRFLAAVELVYFHGLLFFAGFCVSRFY